MAFSILVRGWRSWWAAVGVALLPLAAAGPVHAQGYPNNTIRLVSPFAAGTAGDNLGRLTAQKLSEKMGVSVVLENRPGASGTVGADYVRNAKPDGYTILLGGGPLALNQSLDPTIPFKVEKDFTPLATIARTKIIVVTGNRPDTPKTMGELLSVLRTKGESVNYGSVGPVTMGRLTTAAILNKTGLRATHVAYKGSNESLIALMRGDVLFASDAVSAVLGQIRSNQLRPLAVASDQRLPTLPDVPTLAEAGVSGVDLNVWYGLLAPAGLPDAVAAKLAQGIAAVAADAGYRSSLANIQFEVFHQQQAEFRAFILKELEAWSTFFRVSKLDLSK
jgi:tripartite-type tricarboxylate transporter receptor subunit TctC